jgi:hypothetical protein
MSFTEVENIGEHAYLNRHKVCGELFCYFRGMQVGVCCCFGGKVFCLVFIFVWLFSSYTFGFGFEIVSSYAAQVGLMILLPRSSECWDHKSAPQCLANRKDVAKRAMLKT